MEYYPYDFHFHHAWIGRQRSAATAVTVCAADTLELLCRDDIREIIRRPIEPWSVTSLSFAQIEAAAQGAESIANDLMTIGRMDVAAEWLECSKQYTALLPKGLP